LNIVLQEKMWKGSLILAQSFALISQSELNQYNFKRPSQKNQK